MEINTGFDSTNCYCRGISNPKEDVERLANGQSKHDQHYWNGKSNITKKNYRGVLALRGKTSKVLTKRLQSMQEEKKLEKV